MAYITRRILLKNKAILVSLLIVLTWNTLRLASKESPKKEDINKPNVEELRQLVDRQENIEYEEPKVIVAEEKPIKVNQSRGGEMPKEIKTVEVTATAYSPDCDPHWNKPAGMSKGLKAVIGKVIAVDPRVIPMGSIVYIEFSKDTHLNGYYQAVDTGGAIKQNRIDVLLQSDRISRKFGRQKAIVKIMK